MMRLTKLTDYAILLLTQLAGDRTRKVHTARDLSSATSVPLPTVSKILKALARGGLLASSRGVGGGFTLSRPASGISVADVIQALEGPIAIADCVGDEPSYCSLQGACTIRGNWERINETVRVALSGLTIAEMAAPGVPWATAGARAANPAAPPMPPVAKRTEEPPPHAS